MIAQAVFNFKFERTEKSITPHGGLPFFVRYISGLERMPCGTFKANAVFFRLGILSYNLFVGFKRLCCPDDWHKYTVKTFRWRLFNVAGQVVRHARQLIVRLRIDRELLRVFEYISCRIDMLRMDLSS